MTEKEDELNFENFREKDAIVLRAIEAKGGETDTVELVEATGFNHQQIAYRYEKFEERSLAEVRKKADDSTPGLTMNEVRLTEKGRRMLDSPHVRRLLGDSSDGRRVQLLQMQTEINELREELEECRRDVSDQESQREDLDERVDIVENDVDGLRTMVPSNVEGAWTKYEQDKSLVMGDYECIECHDNSGHIPPICPRCGRMVANSPVWE